MPRTRLSSPAGQVAAEYMGGLLLVAVAIAALLGAQLHTGIAVEAQRAICKITGSAGCGEPGVPRPEDADADPGEPDREVHDAECDNHLPGDLIRDEGDDPAGGDQEANQVYDDLGSVFDYYSTTFGRDSYQGTDESFAAVGLDGTWEAPEVEGC
jgi:hypothetical protein